MPALPLSSAAGPGDSVGVSEAWVGSGGLSAAGPAAASAVDGSSAASLLPEGPSAAAALLSGDAASSDEDAEGLPDVSLSGAPPGDASDAVLSLGEAAPESEVGASEGAVSDLEAAGVALGVAAACSGGDAAGAFSDFSAAAGAFDGEADEPEAECFGEAAGASAAKATAAEATRRTTARARARAMVGACDPARRFPSGGHGVRSRRGAK